MVSGESRWSPCFPGLFLFSLSILDPTEPLVRENSMEKTSLFSQPPSTICLLLISDIYHGPAQFHISYVGIGIRLLAFTSWLCHLTVSWEHRPSRAPIWGGVALVKFISLPSVSCSIKWSSWRGGIVLALPPPSRVTSRCLQEFLHLVNGGYNSPYFIALFRVKRVDVYEEFRVVAGV